MATRSVVHSAIPAIEAIAPQGPHESSLGRTSGQDARFKALLEYAAFTNMDAAPAVEIVWTQAQGGDQCIGRDDLATKVQAAVGQSPPILSRDGPPDKAVVTGSIGQKVSGQGWVAAIEVRRGDGPPLRRELHLSASDCRQLDETIVLVVEMLLDAAILQRPALIIENPPPAIAVSIGPDVAIGTGMFPGISFGVGLVGEAELNPVWPIDVWGHFWSTIPGTDRPVIGQFEAWTFGAAACRLTFPRHILTLFGCVGASAGWVQSTGIANLAAYPQPSANPYVEIDARVGLRLRVVRPLVVRLALGAGIPLVLSRYFYDQEANEVFLTNAITTTVEFGIEFRAPW